MITPQIFSARTAIRLFKEEKIDLALVAPELINAASKILEEEGDHAAASDIHARFDDYQEELRCLEAQARAEFNL